MNLVSSALAIGFLAFRRSITASTDGWNFDCKSARFCASGEMRLEATALSDSVIINVPLGRTEGGVLAATPATPLPCPPAPPPPPTFPPPPAVFALAVPDRVTTTD